MDIADKKQINNYGFDVERLTLAFWFDDFGKRESRNGLCSPNSFADYSKNNIYSCVHARMVTSVD